MARTGRARRGARRARGVPHHGSAAARRPPLVVESWRRSARSGVDPDAPQPDVSITDADLGAYRSQHPLARAMPIVRDLLVAGLAGRARSSR
ncbi:hypothetical protein NKG05_15665 [Oerskovia sp. M15]